MGASGRRATVDPERWLDPSGPYYQEETTQQTQRYDELEGDDDEPLVRPHRQVMSPRVVGLDGRDDLKEANIDELRGLVTESEFRLIRELRMTIRNFGGYSAAGNESVRSWTMDSCEKTEVTAEVEGIPAGICGNV